MSILNDTWRFPRCLCCSFPCFFSSWELSSNQRWLLIQECRNVRQLNYTTCNTGVAFSNGCTIAFGFFPLSRRKLPFLWRKPIFQLAVPQQTCVESYFTLGMILTHKNGGTLLQLVSISLRIVWCHPLPSVLETKTSLWKQLLLVFLFVGETRQGATHPLGFHLEFGSQRV